MTGARLAAWGPAVIWMAATFVISHQPKVAIPFDAPDYLAHGVSYAVLGALLTRALAGGRLPAMTWRLAAMATVMGALYGLSDEFHQSFIPGRFASLSDLVADTAGSAAGALAAAALGAWRRTRAPKHPST